MQIDTDVASGRAAQLWFAAWLGREASCQFIDCATPVEARASFDRNKLCLPRHDLMHHRASVAHFYAHARFGGTPFAVGKLRPIQIVLTSLFEDARVEQLALRERPGLRRLWAPYIETLRVETRANGGNDVAGLLRRLTIALFDPAWPHAHPWVDKARHLFHSRRAEWRDPALSRDLGNLLGNDIGQMRLQFNWRSYAVEPAYRDDHRGLWCDADEPLPEQEQPAGIRADAAAIPVAGAPVAGETVARCGEVGDWLSAGAPTATALETLPEWDYERGFYRAAWVSVREQAAVPDAKAQIPKIADAAALWQHWQRRAPAIRRYRRAHDGDALDLDACIRSAVDRRLGHSADLRIYRRPSEQRQSRTLLILVDTSLSMENPSNKSPFVDATDGTKHEAEFSALAHAKAAALQLIEYAMRDGLRFAVYGFCSDGRHALFMTRVKNFSESCSRREISARLAGLSAAYSTRLGGALRHAQNQLLDEPAAAREIVVLSDGDVGDIDAVDPQYLLEDARQALRELTTAGITVDLVDCSQTTRMEFLTL